MSANLALVCSIYAAIERGDYRRADWADPEIEYVVVDGPSPGSVTGLPGMTESMRTMFGGMKDLRTEAEDYRELGDERILVLTRLSGQGKASGIPVEQRGAEVFEIGRSKVTKVDVYFDRNRAFADLGLEE